MPMLTQERLKELLDYDAETGIFRWKIKRGRQSAGSIAGGIVGWGYWHIEIYGSQYKAHRLAFLYMQGIFPPNDVDHINGDRIDNRWVNLRQATRTENMCNSSLAKNNTSGIKGVTWDKDRGKWHAQITVNKRLYNLGRYNDINQAASIVRVMRKRLHGDFAKHG